MKIVIETIPHDRQRYPTVGDWFVDDMGVLFIRVSELGDTKMEALIGLHELVEAFKCFRTGVSQAQVDAFDIRFDGKGEPGDAPGCPYGDAHRLATVVESLMARELGVNWQEYESKIGELP